MQLSRSVHGHCQGYTGHLRRFFLYQKEICFSQLEMKLTQPYESEIQCNLYDKTIHMNRKKGAEIQWLKESMNM